MSEKSDKYAKILGKDPITTASRWSEYFREEKGIHISTETIRLRMEADKNIQERKRELRGRMVKVFAESDILRVFSDLLENCSQADENGFFRKNGMLFGNAVSWGKKFDLSYSTIERRLEKIGAIPENGRAYKGNGPTRDFYSERDVRKACEDLINTDRYIIDADGLVLRDGARLGTQNAWAKFLNLSTLAVWKRFRKAKIKPFSKGKAKGKGCNYYTEDDVRRACSDLLAECPQANEDGFFIVRGVKYGNIAAWGRLLKVNENPLRDCIKRHKLVPIKGKLYSGHVKFIFYSEPDIKKACAHLLKDHPQADENGFFVKNGMKFGNRYAWAKLLRVDRQIIMDNLKLLGITPIEGRSYNNINRIDKCYYSESDIRKALALNR